MPQSEAERDYMDKVPYASAVGRLMYVVTLLKLLVWLADTWGSPERSIG